MGTANSLMTTPAAPGWLSKPRGVVIALGAASAAVIALSEHWLAISDLVPLLFVLPCAAMMLKCARGKNRDPQMDAAAQSDNAHTSRHPELTPTGTGRLVRVAQIRQSTALERKTCLVN